MGLFKPNIAKLQRKGNISGLVSALQAEDRSVGLSARDALIRIGEPAVPEIVSTLHQARPAEQKLAVEALAGIGGEKGVAALKAALNATDREVRLTAVRGLDKIGTPHAARAALEALGDQDRTIGREVIEVLIRIGRPILPQIEEGLIGQVRYGDRHRIRASAVLANLIGPESLDTLLQILEDLNPNVRFNAVSGLSHFRNERSADGLFRALEDRAPDVRAHAEQCLMKMDPSTIPEELLRSQLDRENRAARSCADLLLRKKGRRLGRCPSCGGFADVDAAAVSEHQEDPRELDEAYGVYGVMVKVMVCPNCGSALVHPVTGERLEERSFLHD